MLVCTMLVFMMTLPGLALYYGGLARSKNVLSVVMQILVGSALILLLWIFYGYSLVFAGSGHVLGDFSKAFLHGLQSQDIHTPPPFHAPLHSGVPEYLTVAFYGGVAAFAVALIAGATAGRTRFSAFLLFGAIWFSLCFVPLAHMVWGRGFLASIGLIDSGGGTVIHIAAGTAALVAARKVGPRLGYATEHLMPHSLALSFTGAALLWLGWGGLNAGLGDASGNAAALAVLNTMAAASAGIISWLVSEAFTRARATMLGAISGAIAGLVAITPAAPHVSPAGAIVTGLIAAPVCLWGVNGLRQRLRIDDALDVFGIHGLGGITGVLLAALLSAPALGGTLSRGFGVWQQFGIQMTGVFITILWSATAAIIACKVADALVGLRVSAETERDGLDLTTHGESAYGRFL